MLAYSYGLPNKALTRAETTRKIRVYFTTTRTRIPENDIRMHKR